MNESNCVTTSKSLGTLIPFVSEGANVSDNIESQSSVTGSVRLNLPSGDRYLLRGKHIRFYGVYDWIFKY